MEKELKIIVILNIQKEEYKTEVLKTLREAVDETRKEEGNISYDLYEDIKNPLSYVLIEVWKSQDAIDFHNNTTHFKTLVGAINNKANLSVSVIKKSY